MSLDTDEVNRLWLAIDVVEAQETLLGITKETYPHMKATKQKEIHKKFYTAAYPRDIYKPKSISISQLGLTLNGAKNGKRPR